MVDIAAMEEEGGSASLEKHIGMQCNWNHRHHHYHQFDEVYCSTFHTVPAFASPFRVFECTNADTIADTHRIEFWDVFDRRQLPNTPNNIQ